MKSLVISLQGSDYPVGIILSVMILGIGALLLLKITLSITHTGTKILLDSIRNNKAIAAKKYIFNLDSKLNQLKTLSEQGKISTKAYEDARDNYMVRNIMDD